MIESLVNIYKGSATIIKNKQYFSAKAYIEPFAEKLKDYTTEFICFVKPADQISYNDDSVAFVYNRALIIGIFPSEYDITTSRNNKPVVYRRVVCMSYALDVKNPVCKFYTGVIDSDDSFYAFGGDCISIQKLEPETAIDYSSLQSIIDNGLNDNCEAMLSQLQSMYIERPKLTEILGNWIDFSIRKEYINDSGKTKLSNGMPIEAYKALMIDRDSDVYKDGNEVFYPEIMKSFFDQVRDDDKDIVSRYEKTQLINNLLEL